MGQVGSVKERPIIFSPSSVHAILQGRKNQTRRPVDLTTQGYSEAQPSEDAVQAIFKPPAGWEWWGPLDSKRRGLLYQHSVICPYGLPGQRLWIKEPWWCNPEIIAARKEIEWTPEALSALDRGPVTYKADGGVCPAGHRGWRNAMFMPRWVSRLLIEVTEVRVERVQSISYNDAMAEGVPPVPCLDEAIEPETLDRLARSAYEKIWASIHINDGHEWKKNPWVWAVTFKEIKA